MTADALFDLDPAPDVLRTAQISECGRYRYALTRLWGNPLWLLTFIMLNPSTADALMDDPTVVRCMGFARDLGYDGIRVVNLYAFRATKPADLWTAADPTGGAVNDAILRDTLAHDPKVIAAWGTNAKPDRVAWLLRQPGAEHLSALHVTKSGAPGHPLYLPASARPAPWPEVA